MLVKRLSHVFLLVVLLSSHAVAGERVTTTWSADAGTVYDTGFMHMLMKHPSGGASLFDMDLVENDAPGSGTSEKGVSRDVVWGSNQARKVLNLEDIRAEKVYLVLFFSGQGKHPLRITVNGNPTQVDNWDLKTCHLTYRWTEFPVSWLKKGKNVVDLSCPEAASAEEGWNLYLARADEFEHGGGDPANVGETSFKSTDGGESWKKSPFGPLGQTRAEYSVRLSFDRYVRTGWLATPVIDLWKGDETGFITPVRIPKKILIALRSAVPEETSVEYFYRVGTSPEPFSKEWGPYKLIGSGEAVDIELDDKAVKGRFLQIRAVLTTDNPLETPVVRSVRVETELLQGFTAHESVKTVRADNPVIKYSSIDWEWEPWDRPELKEVRERENLDAVVAGSKTQFEMIMKLLEYATTRVPRMYSSPMPDYPGWDARSILERIDQHGSLGMCIQFNNLLMGLCLAYGIQGRLLNVMNHEVAEVWSDDFGKWVYLEASYANHYLFDMNTCIPMGMYELHNTYLDYFFPDRAIDWMNELTSSSHTANLIREREDKPPVMRSSTTYHQNEMLAYKGLVHSPFMRAVPRNNFYEKPYPMPLSHGSAWWPWNGYINWYDNRTPPKRQYSWHTDRPRDMWPDLNLVRVHATSAHFNKFLYLRFETYTPNFSHFEIYENDCGWKRVDNDRWTWVLVTGKNTLRVRAVTKLGVNGKPSHFEVYRTDVPLEDLY